MKVLSIVYTALLAVASAEAVANPAPDAEAMQRFCHRPGQGCSKLKRAADAAAEALAFAAPVADADADIQHFCHRPGQGCSKAKRAAEALAYAIADANAVANAAPEADPGKLIFNIAPLRIRMLTQPVRGE